jgi:hypothetical protein
MFTELFKSLLNHEQVFACKFHRIKKARKQAADSSTETSNVWQYGYGKVVGVARLIHERNDVFSDIVGWLTWLIAGC